MWLGAPAACEAYQDTEQPYVHRAWRLDDGLPQNSIYAIEQTRDGYLWIGTLQGLVRFDGHRFTTFDPLTTVGLEGSRIVGLAEADDGALWIATQGHGLTRYHRGVFRTYSVRDGLPSNAFGPVGDPFSTSGGSVWVAMDRGLASFVPDSADGPGRFTPAVIDDGLPDGATLVVFEDDDGSMWIGTEHGLGYRAPSRTTWRMYGTEDGLTGEQVGSVLKTSVGELWVGSGGGIARHDPVADRFESVAVEADLVFSMLEDRAGTLWAGSAGEGLLRFTGDRFEPVRLPNADIGNSVVYLFEDRERHLWIGTNGNGLHRLKQTHFSSYAATPYGSPGPMTHGIVESRTGDVWAATYASGLLRIDETGRVRSYGVQDGLPGPTVWSLAETDDGTLWVGSERGLVRRRADGDRFESFPIDGAPELGSQRISSFLVEDSGSILIGTFRAAVYRLDPTGDGDIRARLVLRPEQVSEGGSILSLLTGSDGALWVGTQAAGIARLRGDELTFIGSDEGLDRGGIRTLVERPDGSIWAGTYGSGICAVPPGETRVTCLTRDHGLPDNTIHAIVEDDFGFVWTSSNHGLFRMRSTELDAFFRGENTAVRADVYTRADGLPSTEFNGAFQPTSAVRRDGRLLFPTTNGVAVVDPLRMRTSSPTADPVMHVETLTADDTVLPAQPGVELPAGTNRTVLSYTGIHFGNPDALRFEYRLDGYDDDDVWIEGGDDRVAIYTSLEPGPYTFRVRGALGSAAWMEASLPFTLAPLVYQTLWFRVLAGLLLAAFVAGSAASVQRQRYRRELTELEARRALEAERTRISRDMHDEVGASLSEIAILSELARRELSAPVHAEVRLDRIASVSREMLDALGQIVWAINPQNDRLPALIGYVREHASHYLDTAGVEATFDFPARTPDLPITAETRRNIFVIVKEALHNVVKHASASVVTVQVRVDDSELSVVVEDDGAGFTLPSGASSVAVAEGVAPPSSRPDGGQGFRNMGRRAAEVGGTLTVTTAAGAGVRLELRVPLSR